MYCVHQSQFQGRWQWNRAISLQRTEKWLPIGILKEEAKWPYHKRKLEAVKLKSARHRSDIEGEATVGLGGDGGWISMMPIRSIDIARNLVLCTEWIIKQHFIPS